MNRLAPRPPAGAPAPHGAVWQDRPPGRLARDRPSGIAERRAGYATAASDERAMALAWETQALRGLRTVEGQALVVLSPGHRCPDPGPDFRNAILRADDGTVWQGDVELHRRASDWRAHGHDRDPNYDRVVLHVVLDPAGGPARRRDGSAIPTVILSPDLSPLASGASERPCRTHGGLTVRRLLADLSLARLEAKAAAFVAASGPAEPQALYAALLEALGHPHNRAAYRAVADRLPLDALRPLAALPLPARIWQTEARLLGAAGLLPPPAGLPPADAARARAMRALATCHAPLPWRLVGLRPANRPARRLVGAAHLVARALSTSLPDYLSAPLALPTPAARWRALLARLVVVDHTGFWAGRTGLGQPLRHPLPALVGPGRAVGLVLNVVLPWVYLHDPARASATWRAAPPSAATWKERHVLRAAGVPTLGGGAAQQGALHVFAHWCHCYDCAACPLGAPER